MYTRQYSRGVIAALLMTSSILLLPSVCGAGHAPGAFGSQGTPSGGSTGDGSAPFVGLASMPEANQFTGMATTAIEIVVPPGREKMTPKVSLRYSSTTGRSPYGYGWSVPVPKVSRSTKNGVPCFCDADIYVLELNGTSAELVFVNNNAFKPKIEAAFLKIQRDKTSNLWRIYDRDGTEYTFGGTPNGRLPNPVSSFDGTSEWLLTQAHDYNVSSISYQYTSAAAGLSAGLPLKISYGGTSGTGADVVDPFSIEFVWEPTYDGYPVIVPLSFAGGVPTVLGRRLTQILTKAAGRIVREYSLVHQKDPVSGTDTLGSVGLLAHGKRANSCIDNVDMPSASFSYAPPLQRTQSGSIVGYHTGGLFTDPAVPTSSVTFQGTDDPHRYGRLHDRPGTDSKAKFATIDMNGDGVVDYVDATNDVSLAVKLGSVDSDGKPVLTASAQVWRWPVYANDANAVTQRLALPSNSESKLVVSIFDLDGDGLPEVVDTDENRCSSALSSEGIVSPSLPAGKTTWRRWCVYPVDVDSQGSPRIDALNRYGFQNRPRVWIAPFDDLRKDTSESTDELTDNATSRDLFDFDGDGRPDFVSRSSADQWTVYKNQGDGFAVGAFFSAPKECNDLKNSCPGVAYEKDYLSVRGQGGFYDINGDGLRDFVLTHAANDTQGLPRITGDTYWTVYLNTGRNLEATPRQWRVEGGAAVLPNRIGLNIRNKAATVSDLVDVTGDGLPDLVKRHVAGDGYPAIPLTCDGSGTPAPSAWDSDAGTFSEGHCWNLLLFVNTGSSFASPVPLPFPANALRADYDGTCRRTQTVGSGSSYVGSGCYDLMDFNGDGLVDLVGAMTNAQLTQADWAVVLHPASPGAIPPPAAQALTLGQTKPNVLTSMMNGVGGVTTLEYAAVSSIGEGGLPFPYWVVQQTNRTDVLSGVISTFDQYVYRNAFFDRQDREFRGFGAVRVITGAADDASLSIGGNYRDTVPGSGASALTEFYQDDRRKGLVSKRWSFGVVPASCGTFGGTDSVSLSDPCSPYHYLMRLDENCWEQDPQACCWADATGSSATCEQAHPPQQYADSPAPILLWAERSTPFRVDDSNPVASESMEVEKHYEYDLATGNRTAQTVYAGGFEVAQTRTTYVSLSEWNQRNLVSRPKSVVTTDSGAQGLQLQGQVFEYSTGAAGSAFGAKLTSSTACTSIVAAGGTCAGSKTSFTYDAWGNLNSKRDPARVVTSTIFDAEFHLYPETMVDAANAVSYSRYDEGIGKEEVSQSANGFIIQTAHDGLGRAIRVWSNIVEGAFSFEAPQKSVRYVTPTVTGYSGSCPGNHAAAGQPGRVEERTFLEGGRAAASPSVAFYDGTGRVLGVKTLTDASGVEKVLISKQPVYDRLGSVTKDLLPRVAVSSSLTTWNEPFNAANAAVIYGRDRHGRLVSKNVDTGTVRINTVEPGVTVTEDANLTARISGEPGMASIVIADALGNQVSTETCSESPEGPDYSRCPAGKSLNRTFFTTDALGRVVRVEQAVNPNGPDTGNRIIASEVVFDALGLVWKKRDYDAGGVDQDYGESVYRYDRAGKVLRVTGPGGSLVQYRYDRSGRPWKVLSRAPGRGRAGVIYSYGENSSEFNLGRMTSAVSTTKTSLGQTASVTRTVQYTVDGKIDTEQTTISGGTTYGSSQAQVSYDYDASGRVRDTYYPALLTDGSVGSEVVRTFWNTYGQAKCLKSVDPAVATLDCSSSPALRTIVGNIDYDVYGNAIDLAYGNGLHDYALFDTPANNFRLLCRKTSTSATPPQGCAYDAASDLQALSYSGYDSLNRIRSITDLKSVNAQIPVASLNSQNVTYDAMGRVVSASYSGGGSDVYSFDYLGNIAGHSRDSIYTSYEYSWRHPHRATGMIPGTASVRSLTYADDGARTAKDLQSYGYDAIGRLAEVYEGSANSTSPIEKNIYDWSGERVVRVGPGGAKTHYFAGGLITASGNRLTRYFSIGGRTISRDEAVGSAGFVASTVQAPNVTPLVPRHSDRLEERVQADPAAAVAVLAFVLLFGSGVAAFRVAPTMSGRVAAATAGLVLFTAIPLPGALVGRMAGVVGPADAEAQSLLSVSTYFMHTDHLGSVQFVTDSARAVVESLRYRVFGDVRWSKNDPYNAQRTFTGHVYDEGPNFLYMGARHYDPETSTFLTFDPAGQYASPYTYAGNNPMGLVDPTGAVAEGIAAILTVLASASAIVGAFNGATALASAALGGGDLGAALIGVAVSYAMQVIGIPASQVILETTSLAVQIGIYATRAAMVGVAAYGAAGSIVNGNIGMGIFSAVMLAAGVLGGGGSDAGAETSGAMPESGNPDLITDAQGEARLQQAIEFARQRRVPDKYLTPSRHKWEGGVGAYNNDRKGQWEKFPNTEERTKFIKAQNELGKGDWRPASAYTSGGVSHYFRGSVVSGWNDFGMVGLSSSMYLGPQQQANFVVLHEIGHQVHGNSEWMATWFAHRWGGIP